MIQRIQTVFLFLASVTGILMFFFPIATYYQNLMSDDPTGNYVLLVTGLRGLDPDPKIDPGIWFASPLLILTGICILFSLIALFLYKKRFVQLRLVAFTILLTLVEIVLIFLFYLSRVEALTLNTPAYQPGSFLPLLSLVWLLLAYRFIRKDEQLVRSADRLR